jgi:ubiquinone/menaquinone biosynthesis C-methylase UbiE
MSTPNKPRPERPSTYFVQDRSNEEELTRLTIQDQILTKSMGGVLPEQADPAIFRQVLDVGCGTGGWLIEVAKAYPAMTRLIGIDISERMITYARAQAKAHQVSDRIEFHTMDALCQLEFPDGYFDLVNQRLGLSYLRTWDWLQVLQEFQRVARLGGVIRLTEANIVESNSPALARREELLLQAFFHAGHFFKLEKDGVTKELSPLLHRHGFRKIQTHTYTLEYRAGTAEGERFAENMKHGFRTLQPFIRKWTRVPDDYKAVYQQMSSEMAQPGFVANWSLLTAWGNNG